jgi:hypothetical protein
MRTRPTWHLAWWQYVVVAIVLAIEVALALGCTTHEANACVLDSPSLGRARHECAATGAPGATQRALVWYWRERTYVRFADRPP